MSSGTIAIVLIIIAFVIYFVCSSNGVKLFGKKEHKVKAKKSNEEKYADVLPKEKKEHKLKIFDGARKEKLKEDIKKDIEKNTADKPAGGEASKAEPAGNPKVSKITKEDFLKNNIDVPKNSNWLSEEDKKKEAEIKALPKEKEQPSMPYDFGGNFNDGGGDTKSAVDDDDPFAGIDIDAILAEHGLGGDDDNSMPPSPRMSRPMPPELFDEGPADIDDEEKYNQLASEEYFAGANGPTGIGARSLEERFEEVFGKGYLDGKGNVAKEIIVGDILSSPRSKINSAKRKERQDRLKWM